MTRKCEQLIVKADQFSYTISPPLSPWAVYIHSGRKSESPSSCVICRSPAWRYVGVTSQSEFHVGECEQCENYFVAPAPQIVKPVEKAEIRKVYDPKIDRKDLLGHLRLKMSVRALDSTTRTELVKRMETWFLTRFPDTPDSVRAEELLVVVEAMRVEKAPLMEAFNGFLREENRKRVVSQWNANFLGQAYANRFGFWEYVGYIFLAVLSVVIASQFGLVVASAVGLIVFGCLALEYWKRGEPEFDDVLPRTL